ncbi:amidohydrolase family protein [Conexibacter sp. CPCC 206217]|uniref:amidohydrolase family protein n=1 Tax=Conexibacter sp. CPCC 206217 TaxID=3064574 RepID=UPI00271EE96C|nr:amidohydrolase family protein [Conexibacter sp. CPCC 206217]MDO8212533.1 amidohydrolase family protein [Conexibacter sp. CPCC 206217]
MIDVHCHLLPASYPELVGELGAGTPPPGVPAPPGLKQPDACWERLGDDGWAVVAPPPLAFRDDLEGERLARFAAGLNDGMVALAAGRPRAAVLGWLPLGDPATAVAEVERLAGEQVVVGMAVGAAPGSRPLSDPALDEVWAALAAADLGLFVHPDGDPLGAAKTGARPSILGFPTVTTAALLDLLAADCALWDSGVRLCAAHGGGFVAVAHSRATRLLDPEARAAQQRRLDSIWVDGVVFDPRFQSFLTELFPAGRVLLGSDWPFPLSLTSAELSAQAQASVIDPFQAATAWCPRLARLA